MYQQLRRAAILCLLPLSALAGPQLVTPDEAALPPGEIPRLRGINRGPTVEVVAPAKAVGKIRSPLNFRVRFEPHSGNPIDLSSFQFLYIKVPTVDLTPRVTPFLTDKGFSIDAANVPPGEHTFVVSIADSTGRRGTAVVAVVIER